MPHHPTQRTCESLAPLSHRSPKIAKRSACLCQARSLSYRVLKPLPPRSEISYLLTSRNLPEIVGIRLAMTVRFLKSCPRTLSKSYAACRSHSFVLSSRAYLASRQYSNVLLVHFLIHKIAAASNRRVFVRRTTARDDTVAPARFRLSCWPNAKTYLRDPARIFARPARSVWPPREALACRASRAALPR